jgi:hypothetical protein
MNTTPQTVAAEDDAVQMVSLYAKQKSSMRAR